MAADENEWLTLIEDSLLKSDIGDNSYNAARDWSPSSPLTQSYKLCLSDEHPFKDLKIGNTEDLSYITGRNVCCECGKSRKYYCYSCCIPLEMTKGIIPTLDALPLKVDIVKHKREIDGKSTATHAKVICPSHVRIFIYPELPPNLLDNKEENIVLVYPGKNSLPLRDYLRKDTKSSIRIDRVIFIDSTWNQAKGIYADPKLRSLPTIILEERETIFWRYQTGKAKECLSTIEAIYYFILDYSRFALDKSSYNGEYDNLLFLFKFMFEKIHKIYGKDNLRRYKGTSLQ
ncbi:tRNA-uridine aminocarboxypropyltransferase 1 [Lepeophtheirus salmonis]|nr:tRNA-uridine aminocarboxypropyltransferase 1-like [Lepeophtheirus salmonis]